jgi:hypothetical protein
MKIPVLDDYQDIALKCADWSRVLSAADVTVFTDHVSDTDELVGRLAPFDVLCVMRERTPLPRTIIERAAQTEDDRFNRPRKCFNR